MIQIEITNQHDDTAQEPARLRSAVEQILADKSPGEAVVSVAIVDDPTIRQLNRRFLGHDEATDVLSFVLDRQPGRLEGEIVLSAQTAQAAAGRFGWSADDELLLYVIHGALHLVGYNDSDPESRAEMRRQEREYLGRFGVEPRYEE